MSINIPKEIEDGKALAAQTAPLPHKLADLDDESPHWLLNHCTDGLVDGEGAGEDHKTFADALDKAGFVGELRDLIHHATVRCRVGPLPRDMVLHCPACGLQHIDKEDTTPCKDGCQYAKDVGQAPEHSCAKECFYMSPGSEAVRWTNPPHRSHLCLGCGHIWRPADVPTNGVQTITTVGTNDSAPVRAQPRLKVRLTSFPESNGKTNWTALLVREEKWDGLVGNCGGVSLARGECWNRVAWVAEEAKFLIGARDTEPFILDYGDDIKTPEEWKGETAMKRVRRVKPE